MSQKIKAAIVIEIMGRPKEHIADTMGKLIDAMGGEKGIAVSGKTIHEPKKVDHKDKEGKVHEVSENIQLYTTFAEINIEAENLTSFVLLCFKYMPAHVEIFDPADLKMNNFETNSLLNELMARLHHYDAIAKTALTYNEALANKLKEVMAGKTGLKTEEKPEIQTEGKISKKAKKKK